MARERPDIKHLAGQELTVIAWIWARTVKSPNPAFSHVDVPLASTFVLSKKEGKESYVHPIVEGDSYRFTVKLGTPPDSAEDGTKAPGRGANFRCIVSDTVVDGDYIKAEGVAGRMGAKLLAVVAEGTRNRIYLSPTPEAEALARSEQPKWRPVGDVPARLTGGTCVPYGLKEWGDLFTTRQLVTLTLFSDLISEARKRIYRDDLAGEVSDDSLGLEAGGAGPKAYAEAVSVYLAFIIDKLAEALSSICTWSAAPKNELVVSTFRRQALPMTWDFAEANPFATSSGSLEKVSEAVARVVDMALTGYSSATVQQADAQTQEISTGKRVSTDPPYYDNIGYADLSDFFYVWLRSSLRPVFPALFSTIAVPKAEELVATAHRHGSREKAETFFLTGMTQAMSRLSRLAHPEGPITIY
jgi:putative DNA methylase